MATRVQTGRRQTANEQKNASRTTVAGGASISKLGIAISKQSSAIKKFDRQLKELFKDRRNKPTMPNPRRSTHLAERSMKK